MLTPYNSKKGKEIFYHLTFKKTVSCQAENRLCFIPSLIQPFYSLGTIAQALTGKPLASVILGAAIKISAPTAGT